MVRYVQFRVLAATLALLILLPNTIASSPDTVVITMSKAQFTVLESPSGLVQVFNETHAGMPNITVTITHVSGLIRHESRGTTDAEGKYVFDLGLDMTARTPGPHDVFVTAATRPVTSFGYTHYLVLTPV